MSGYVDTRVEVAFVEHGDGENIGDRLVPALPRKGDEVQLFDVYFEDSMTVFEVLSVMFHEEGEERESMTVTACVKRVRGDGPKPKKVF